MRKSGRRELNRRFFERDDDWKPEPPEPVQKKLTEPSYPTAATIHPPPQALGHLLASRDNKHRSLLTIIELECDPPKFIMIMDDDKALIRFPFGGMETTDITPARGATRETFEEVGIPEDVGTPISDNDKSFIREISFGSSIFYVFTKKIPASTQIVLGKEQELWAPFTADRIDELVVQGLVAYKHAKSWEEFKRQR